MEFFTTGWSIRNALRCSLTPTDASAQLALDTFMASWDNPMPDSSVFLDFSAYGDEPLLSPPSLVLDLSPASSTSSLDVDSASPVTPPASELDLPTVDAEPLMPFGRDDGMHIDHVEPACHLPPLTLDALGLYLHAGPNELAVPVVPKRAPGPGPVRTVKASKRAREERLKTVTNLPAKRSVKVKAEHCDEPERRNGRIHCAACGRDYASEVMYREHVTLALAHDEAKADADLPPVRWVCPAHGRPYTVPTSLQRHCAGAPACEAALSAWCARVGITRAEYLSLNYTKPFCAPIRFEPRTDPKWKVRTV